MILRMFSMYDEKAEAFIRPFFMPNVAMAQRVIIKAGSEMDHPFAQHPSDYILYELGTFDETGAEFTTTLTPIRHGSVKELTPAEETPNHDLFATKPTEVKNG